MNKARRQIPITIVLLCLGIMLSLQFQAQTRIASDLTYQRSDTLIAMVRGLSEKRQKLALEIIDLSNQLRSQMESSRDEKKLLEGIHLEMEKLRIVNGTTALKGPGIMIIIEEHMPIIYTDLLNIINELWNAGAEAISINEHRITSHSTISVAEDAYSKDGYSIFMTVNHEKLTYPIIIKTIGEPNNLEKGLTLPGGIMDNLALFNAYPEIEKVDKLEIPALEKPTTYYFMTEYKPSEENKESTPPTTNPPGITNPLKTAIPR
ncbi:MAG TPA: DUF881 domain-containing protein [Clostridia bacterium]|jgi:uncharacterized protein YlxW (UPF0749 family)|nr:DUF881 domain-containing protein [Clostridia bacterium]HHY06267.1 DUF881 domain-containing protein [Clostridia bacterium]